jgi:broad specificity phosphatase PhoE
MVEAVRHAAPLSDVDRAEPRATVAVPEPIEAWPGALATALATPEPDALAALLTTSPPRGGRLFLVRHGATEWTLSGQHTSRTDLPLTPRGVAEALALPEQDLRELDYGAYEGLTTPQIRVSVPGWTVWSGEMPGGERLEEAGVRADRLLLRIRSALDAGDVVLVGHAHFFRILAARWLGLPPRQGALFALGTGTLCVLHTEHGSRVLQHWNLPNPLHHGG